MSRPTFPELVEALSRPGAAPSFPGSLECIQTHISAVFLADDRVYKLKKPKDFGFLDFTTLEKRWHFCHEEVRLNRRLAPRVYEGVVPVVRGVDGGLRFSDVVSDDPLQPPPPEAEVVEWAVLMVRLPEERTLKALLRNGRLTSEVLEGVAARVARFHREAERGDEISRFGDWPTVFENDRENFRQIEPFVGRTVSRPTFDRLEALAEEALRSHRGLIEDRARSGMPRDTHGDLRLEHLYLLPTPTPSPQAGEQPGGRPLSERVGRGEEVVAIDCVEFNERFRWADPVADVAFPVMELEFEDHPHLAAVLSSRYFEISGDHQGEALLPYYTTYRDIVRGKVRSLQGADAGLGEEAREAAARKATRHFLRALSRLSDPGDRPLLLVVHGLPGVGKSTFARALSASEGFEWIDTDRVRKELAGRERNGAGEAFEKGIYTAEWTERTYAECRRRAREAIFGGRRVLVEGSFGRDASRRGFAAMASELGVPALFIHCFVSEEEAQRRLKTRSTGPSDADWRVHREMAARWEPASSEIVGATHRISLEESEEVDAVDRVRGILARIGLSRKEVPEE